MRKTRTDGRAHALNTAVPNELSINLATDQWALVAGDHMVQKRHTGKQNAHWGI